MTQIAPTATLAAMPWIPILLVFLLAGFVKGVIGLGLPTIAMGLLSLVMAPADAALLLIVPSFVTNLWQLAAGPHWLGLARRLWLMLAGIALGTWWGIGVLTGGHAGRAAGGLGLALTLYAVLGLTRWRLAVPARLESWLSPLIGLTTGLITGATGVFVIPAVPYLQALSLDKEALIQALGLSFTVSTLALAAALTPTLAEGQAVTGSLALGSAVALLPALAGMYGGQWLRHRIRPERFRMCFFIGLLALGLHLGLRAVL